RRPRADRAQRRSFVEAGRARDRGLRRPRAVDVGAPEGVRAGRQAPLRLDVVLELRRRAAHRAPGPAEAEAEAEEAGEAVYGNPACSNDALSHSGVRVGRSVFASTVPWPVQPSARTVPSRSTT